MSLITASDLAKSYGANDIFSGIALSIPKQARIAIVGPNGIGKSTLLRLLIGLEEPSAGRLQRARNLFIGYLPQEAMLQGTHTLWQECLSAIPDLLDLESELTRLEAAMSDPKQAEEALERYGPLQQSFERQGGYTYETNIRQTLSGLGFDPGDFHRPITQLSGGQRTRALLARLLLSNPDLLVLDEPTNHLDIQAVEWLEGHLSLWEGAALIVSHDRYFLDKVVDHIWEMSRDGMEIYRGNYSAYLRQRQERWALRQQSFESEKERLQKELDYIRRNIAGQNTLQAKGRLKRLSRTLDAIEKGGFQVIDYKKWSEISDATGASSQMMTVEEATTRVSGLRNPKMRPPQLSLNLKARRRSGDLVLRTRDLQVGYADEGKPLFHAPDLLLKRGECAALIGPNGAGKTTFLKTLLGIIPPYAGEVILGASLDVAHFAQAHEDLQPERTLVEEIDAVAPAMLERDIRNLLARFIFTGDEVYQKVATLSGGERGRLALAKLSLTKANLLLLDEPTNHLDIPAQEILQEVLAQYQGTILLVSHDRYLIDALATQIWHVNPDETYLRIFEGSYSQYQAILEDERAKQITASPKVAEDARYQQKQASNQEKHLRKRMEALEEQITQLEDKLAGLARKLETPPAQTDLVEQLGIEYVDTQNEINCLVMEWEGLQEKIIRKI
jgi:ATP-binding cassette subfamily F protein 3